MQFDLIGYAVFGIKGAKAMYLSCDPRIVQQQNGGIHLSPSWVVSDEKSVIRVVDGWVGEVPGCSCVEGFNINGRDEVCPPEDDGFRSFRCCGQPLCRFQVSSYVRDKDIIMPIVAFSQSMPSDCPASSKVLLSSLTKVVSSLILACRAMI